MFSFQDDPATCHGYCDKTICWLHNDYVFGFLGPVAFVILFNVVVLVAGLRNVDKVVTRLDVEPPFRRSRSALYFFRPSKCGEGATSSGREVWPGTASS